MNAENLHWKSTYMYFTHTYARTYFAGIVVATAECVVLQKLRQELSLIKKINMLNSITQYRYTSNQTKNAIIVGSLEKHQNKV